MVFWGRLPVTSVVISSDRLCFLGAETRDGKLLWEPVQRSETIEKEKKDEYDSLQRAYNDMRDDLTNLRKQNATWANHLKFLEQSREKLVRDEGICVFPTERLIHGILSAFVGTASPLDMDECGLMDP